MEDLGIHEVNGCYVHRFREETTQEEKDQIVRRLLEACARGKIRQMDKEKKKIEKVDLQKG